MASSSNEADQKFSRTALIALVIGSMVGSGIFALPSSFGRATGALGAMIAWVIAGTGMLMLAFVFQTLSRRRPDLDAGIYAYAKAGFGDYIGFASAAGYWTGCCLADVACLILIKATIGQFLPVFGDGTTPAAIVSASLLVWCVHFLVLRGIKGAAALNTVATYAKIIPILLFIGVAFVVLDPGLISQNFWGTEQPSVAAVSEQVRNTMLLTVFVFVGVEGASVYSRYARDRSDIGFATIAGFLSVLSPARSRDALVLRRDDPAGTHGSADTVHGRRDGGDGRTLGRRLRQRGAADLDPRQLPVMVAAGGRGAAFRRRQPHHAFLSRERERASGSESVHSG